MTSNYRWPDAQQGVWASSAVHYSVHSDTQGVLLPPTATGEPPVTLPYTFMDRVSGESGSK